MGKNWVIVAAGLLWAGLLVPGLSAQDNGPSDIAPNGKGIGTLLHPNNGHQPEGQGRPGGSGSSGSNGIYYHGGPLILGTTHVYYIWYGNWSGNTATSILANLANHIGGSPYFNINTTYYNGSNQHVSNSVTFAGSTFDQYSHGTSLSDSDIQSIVSLAISNGLPQDPNGVYFVLTSADVSEKSGFCTQYCGWHTHGTINGSDIKYAFVGDPDRCPSACEAQTSTSPNNNPGADGMANIIAHELEESVTDPDLNAWYDRRGYENADKCAWTFGTVYKTSNGSYANMSLGGMNYLIQRNWVNASGGYCALSY